MESAQLPVSADTNTAPAATTIPSGPTDAGAQSGFTRRRFLTVLGAVGVLALLEGQNFLGKSGQHGAAPPVQNPEGNERELPITDLDITEAIRRVSPSVFRISGATGRGSGFIVRDGMMLTNFHVTQDNAQTAEWAPQLIPDIPGAPIPGIVHLAHLGRPNYTASAFRPDDRQPERNFRVTPVTDRNAQDCVYSDMALLQVPPDMRAELPPTENFPVGSPQAGRTILVFGSPAGSPGRVTRGHVTCESLQWTPEENERFSRAAFFGTDAAINPGNSGGLAVQLRKLQGQNGQPRLNIEFVGIPTYIERNHDGTGHCIRADLAAYISQQRWGVQLLSPAQMEEVRRSYPRQTNLAGVLPPRAPNPPRF